MQTLMEIRWLYIFRFSEKAVAEARELMISTKNMLKPADGSVVTIPSHEMVLGLYYLTSINKDLGLCKTIFADREEILKK